MYRYFIINKFSCLALFFLLLTTSFKNHPGGKKRTNTINLVQGKQSAGQFLQPAVTVAATDSLYRLMIEASTFLTLKTDRWIFKFKYVREDTLTLHGWYAKGVWGREFKPNPAIELKSSKINILKYSTDMYFGDLVLKKKDVKKIKKKIDENSESVMFTPFVDSLTHTHVGYTISIMNKDKQVINLGTTAVPPPTANPSPPKGFK